MRLIIEFDDYDDDKERIELMLNARNLASAIFEHQQFLRTKLKYDDSLSEDALAAFEACRAHLRDKLNEAQVSEYI